MKLENSIKVSDYLADYLYKCGIRNVFMLSGTGSIHLDDAFAHQKGMRYICARHEAAAVMMAEASAKLSNNFGVVIATTGPGGTNAMSGVAEAWVDSVPLLIISGQVYSNQISKGVRSFGLQGFNIIENVKRITKYAAQINDPKDIRYHLEKAISEATGGRPGPVWLDIPFDIQSTEIKPNELKKFVSDKTEFEEVNPSNIKSVVASLQKSKKPVLVFGQGIRSSDAIKELKTLLEFLKIPAVSARMGLDILPYSNYCYCGLGGIRGQRGPAKIMKECDLVLALGTSFTHAFAGDHYDAFNSSAPLIMVNVDRSEIEKPGLKVNIPLVMDVKKFLTSLLQELKNNKLEFDFSEWMNNCSSYKKDLQTVLPSYAKNPINSYYFIESLNKHSSNDCIFTNDAGSANYISSQALKLLEDQREITSGAFYSMGVAIPLAIGASVSKPKAQIIAITGDGSIELNIQELRTISINSLNIKLFIINNGGYASIRKSQDDMVGGRYTDDIEVLNFSKIAEAFELPFHLIDDYSKLDLKIPEILEITGPVLTEIVCDPKQEVLEPYK